VNRGKIRSTAKGLAKGNLTGLSRGKVGYTLIGTGKLIRSIKWVASKQGVEWGSSLYWAGVHNSGKVITTRSGHPMKFKTEDGWKTVTKVTIPRRQFIGWSNRDREDIRRLIMDYIEVYFNIPGVLNKVESAWMKDAIEESGGKVL
jgi:phage gpG-like protein